MNLVYIILLTIFGYFSAGLIFMGMERRWKFSAYLNGFLSFLKPSEPAVDYKTAVSKEVSEWKEERVEQMFFFWGLFLFLAIILLIALLIELILKKTALSAKKGGKNIWNFFYNGFRIYPPKKDERQEEKNVR